jgi:NAD(P)-dependent dehydrogenase (short-subunit alcohol dehydrogenase family)
LHALIVDGASLFGAQGGRDALVDCLAAVWNAARATARLAFLEGGGGGRIVLLAPPAGGRHAGPAAAGLENLARTLSIEWARYGITTVAVAPGADTTADQLAALACYLLSPAGAYFSGCLMDLRGPAN